MSCIIANYKLKNLNINYENTHLSQSLVYQTYNIDKLKFQTVEYSLNFKSYNGKLYIHKGVSSD